MTNRCTLIVDGNWLMMSRMASMSQQFNATNPDFIKSAATDNLVDSMLTAINFMLYKFRGIVDNMIFVSDGYSWRKTLPVPKQLGDVRYKGNRIRSEELDWDYIFLSLDRISEGLKKNNCTVSHCADAEGDDWVWYWSRRLNGEGTNCIIWTTDNDLKQLLKYDGQSFTAWYNDTNGLFLHKSMEDNADNDIDFFMQFSNNTTYEMLKAVCPTVSYAVPEYVVMNKIICGDTSDNIKSIITVDKGNKTYRITEDAWNTYREKHNIENLSDFFNNEDTIVRDMITLKDKSLNPEDVTPRFDYNKRLVWLDESNYPANVLEQMSANSEYTKFDINYVSENYKTMDSSYQNNDAVNTFLSMGS